MRDDGEKAYPTATFRELPFGARQRRGICILAPEHSAEHPERSFGTGISRLERNPTVIREAVRLITDRTERLSHSNESGTAGALKG